MTPIRCFVVQSKLKLELEIGSTDTLPSKYYLIVVNQNKLKDILTLALQIFAPKCFC